MVVGDGSTIAWTADSLATTVQADAYATARGWVDWLALSPEQKAIAILDASTFIKVSYRPPWSYTTAQLTLIQNAAIEAARLTLTGSLIGAVEEPQVLRDKLEGLETEYAEVKPGSAATARLALVVAMLRAAGLSGGGSLNVPLRKA